MDLSNIQFPAAFQPLFQPYRYKVYHGGRGSGKSWSFAMALLLIGVQRPIRVLCVRELMKSIDDSVHMLLKDQIVALGLGDFYEVQKTTIVGKNGTVFNYEGVRNNAQKVKSYEGIDICWVEEAQKVSSESWEDLIPTIRKDGSEIWISFNPVLPTDPTYVRFVKNAKTLQNAYVRHTTWRDNPWFNAVLRKEMETLKETDYDAYLNVWEGQPRLQLEGAVYAEQLRAVRRDKRICRVPFDPSAGGIEAIFDLGWADNTAIWLRQRVGFELHYLRYYENCRQPIKHYLQWLQAQSFEHGYVYSVLWLPHDAKAKEKGSGMSIEEQVRKAGWKVKIVKGLRVEDGINAARTIFPNCWFDEEGCELGLRHLGSYRYEIAEEGEVLKRLPVHDASSHAADAFRYSAVASKAPKVETETALEAKQTLRLGRHRPMFDAPNTGWLK